MRAGTLYLIPVTLGAGAVAGVLPQSTLRQLYLLDTFVVENAKSARAFLKAAGHPAAVQDLALLVMNEHTIAAELPALLSPLLQGRDCGLLSEAGCPAVADPGAGLVRAAHAIGIRVAPMVGPSSLLLALMASGMNGQRFTFHGYLPADAAGRRQKLLIVERDAWLEDQTQIFIEAPYRNPALLHAILATCRPDTVLCLATGLTLADESVCTRTVAEWGKNPPDLKRRPTVFLLYRGASAAEAGQKR